MSDQPQRTEISPDNVTEAGLFSRAKAEPPRRGLFFGTAIAVVLIAIIAAMVIVRGRHQAASAALNAQLAADPYARNLQFTQLAMSQSTSLSGGTSTFLDGHVRNFGGKTVTGVTVQAVFSNDVGLSPRVDTLLLFLVRTHEPYLDTQPVSAAPLKPGDEVEFRLIFETIPSNWNQQMPAITVVRVTAK